MGYVDVCEWGICGGVIVLVGEEEEVKGEVESEEFRFCRKSVGFEEVG